MLILGEDTHFIISQVLTVSHLVTSVKAESRLTSAAVTDRYIIGFPTLRLLHWADLGTGAAWKYR